MTSPDPRPEAALLFCPFCRECYEGEEVCPVHELPLVDFVDLPKQAHERAGVRGDEPVLPWDPRFGRGLLAAGSVATLVGFFLPLASGTFEDRPTTWSGLDLANGPAPNLWSIPFTAALFGVFLFRRLTPDAMRSARLAAGLLAVTPALSLLYSMRNVARGVEQLHGAVALSWGSGVYTIGAATLLLVVGALRFGASPAGAAERVHAPPEDEAERGVASERKARRRRRR